MSYVVSPFEVAAKALPAPTKVHFVHLLSGVATRHSDTIDCVFFVNGQRVCVAVSCAALTRLREQGRHYLSDQQLAEIAALRLRRTLEQGYDPTQAEIFLDQEEIEALGRELGFL